MDVSFYVGNAERYARTDNESEAESLPKSPIESLPVEVALRVLQAQVRELTEAVKELDLGTRPRSRSW